MRALAALKYLRETWNLLRYSNPQPPGNLAADEVARALSLCCDDVYLYRRGGSTWEWVCMRCQLDGHRLDVAVAYDNESLRGHLVAHDYAGHLTHGAWNTHAAHYPAA